MDKKRVLIIDDELEFLELMRIRVSSWGYEVADASCGAEGIDILCSQKIDIVVLDYIMPDMDGISVLKEIRNVNVKVPVIMFTGYPDIRTQKEAEKLGVSVFVPKLSDYQDVQNTLKSALSIIENNLNKKNKQNNG